MKAGVFIHSQASDKHRELLGAVADGMRRHGVDAATHPASRYESCDVAVIFGMVKWSWRREPYPVSAIAGAGETTTISGLRKLIDHAAIKHGASLEKADLIRQHRGPVLVVERGYVRRDEFWSMGWDGLNGRADFLNDRMPADRWSRLGVELNGERLDGNCILICGQVPWDVSVQDSDHIAWCRKATAASRWRGVPVAFRPHPLARTAYGVDCEISDRSLADDLDRASLVVTWNSNIGVDAAVRGVPVLAHDRGSMAKPASWYGMDYRRPFDAEAKAQWAANLAYAQWTVDEIARGVAWAHIGRRFDP